MIAIVDYGCGNIRSVANALERLDCQHVLTGDAALIRSCDKVILPGVGNDAEALQNLRLKGLDRVIKELRKPVLGICVGMQIMCRDSEEVAAGSPERTVQGLGLFDSHVKRFPTCADAKVPHMGWNCIGNLNLGKCRLFEGLDSLKSGRYMYFVHSYYPTLCQDTIATCRHGDILFSAALKYENFYGTQFHPEKSGEAGERLLKNFIEL